MGWRRALCTFCVLGGAIRRPQIGRPGRQCGAIRQGGNAGGTAAAGAAILCRAPRYMGEGGSGKTAGPFWAWGRIHHPHPLPHSTAFNLPLPYLIPPRKLSPVSHHYPHTAYRGPRRGCRKRGRWCLWKRRSEIITGNSPGYNGIFRGQVFVRMAWATNLCE